MYAALDYDIGLEAAAFAIEHGASGGIALHGLVGEGVAAIVQVKHAAFFEHDRERMSCAGDGAGGVHLAAGKIGDLMFQNVGTFGGKRFGIDRDAISGPRWILLLRRLAGILITLRSPHLRATLRFGSG